MRTNIYRCIEEHSTNITPWIFFLPSPSTLKRHSTNNMVKVEKFKYIVLTLNQNGESSLEPHIPVERKESKISAFCSFICLFKGE